MQPGVITLGTTFTLDRNLSAFMPYNVQVAAYNRYTVSIANFMYDSTTGVVANYGRFVDVMTSEGGKEVLGWPLLCTAVSIFLYTRYPHTWVLLNKHYAQHLHWDVRAQTLALYISPV